MKNYLAIFPLLLLLLVPASAMSQSREELRNSAKAWALQAVLQSLTFDYTNYDKRIAANRIYFTEKGCKTFIAALENYELSERVLDGHNYLTAALWKRHMNVYPLQQINIDEEDYKDGVYKWHLDVPVKLTFRKGNQQMPYNFLATIEVRRRSDVPGFIISRWFTKLKTIGIEPNAYNEYNYKKPRPECKGLPDN